MHTAGSLRDALLALCDALPLATLTTLRAENDHAAAELAAAWRGSGDDRAAEAVHSLASAAVELDAAVALLRRLGEVVEDYAALL